MQPKVSVIVAVYNVAPFLDRCFTSLKAQTLKDFEVIVVDDANTDTFMLIGVRGPLYVSIL